MVALEPAPTIVRDVRTRILETVVADPGINKSELSRQLDVAWGTVCYHVAALVRDGLVASEAAGRERSLFPPGIDPRLRPALAATREPEAKRVLQALRAVRQANLFELAETTQLSRKVVRRHLASLMMAGLVINPALGRPRYMLTERLGTTVGPSVPPAWGARPAVPALAHA
jgi:predicted transcriptional regulator